MGIPKFFRYISERYPLTSQLIREDKIPEFDNLYLDFNGVIHNCSHPNDGDAHFRLSEEQIFLSIFSYVGMLFTKIKPKKLFFIAVDGVAPRAKMNQQRSRRFRTAKEAREVREKAERKGEKLPDEKAFDSNCITPGTTFMASLSNHLRYFINKKITEDSQWRDIQVVLSGHEVPGEGEHKIMEYIRLSRAQPDYNPNIRHCLYGLDADLIMLGLLSHDPHFCLLREEVKFGPSRKKGNESLESTNFYLLHLSLMREYLDLEFRDIESLLPFQYNLERIIDDFILLAVFVGNDFLPNLPDIHIHENGLERLFDIYKKVLPSLDGYINESGTINTRRLQVVLDEMTIWEREIFEKEYADINWYKGKQSKVLQEIAKSKRGTKLALTKPEQDIFTKVKTFVLENRNNPLSQTAALTMPNTFPARERKFIGNLTSDLRLDVTWDEFDEDDQNLVTLRFPGALEESPVQNGNHVEGSTENEGDEWEDVDEEEESTVAIDRVLNKYDKAAVLEEDKAGDFDARHEQSIIENMNEWKRNYYKSKLDISFDDKETLQNFVYRYVEGLQWVMHYYYSGVASWSWFYDYHYAPRISDLRGVDKMSFDFELGTPFHPFEQLMGVLPAASKDLIPLAYQDLMYDPNSPILDFYPTDFEEDLNGKKQAWEAIVKICFIDQKRLLQAMSSREHRLTEEERKRNSFGTSTKFMYTSGETTYYPSSLPNFFPNLPRCACVMEPFDLPTLDGLHLIPGLCDGVFLGAEALAGFPSLQTLPHSASLGLHGVNVHGSDSRNKSMIIHLQNPHERRKVADIAEEMVGKRTFIGWPFLQEGMVVAISDSLFKYEKMSVMPGAPQRIVSTPHTQQGLSHWKHKAERIQQVYSKKSGVITGDVEVLVHVRPLKGLKRLDTGALVKDYDDASKETEQAVQTVISQVASEDPRFAEKDPPPLSQEYPEGQKIFFLGEHAYGVAAQVAGTAENSLSVILAFFPHEQQENEKFKAIVDARDSHTYFPSFKAADMLRMSSRALAKITSSFMVIASDHTKTNLGLSIKFEAKSLKVINYSRKNGRYWEFSEKAVELIREYKDAFPDVFKILDRGGDAMMNATEVFPGPNADAKVLAVKNWLKSKGVRDFEPVSLFADELTKETVVEIEKYQDSLTPNRSTSAIKKAMVKGIPRQAVLKPAHAIYRLQNQHFALGDRVIMVQDSGGVPLAVKGVVIAIGSKTLDVVWDVPFMAGTTLGNRCSQYRGCTVEFNSCLNLSNPQFTALTNPAAAAQRPNAPFKPRTGPYPAIQPPANQQAAAGFRPAPQNPHAVHIMTNPNRGWGGPPGGRGHGGLGHGGPPAIVRSRYGRGRDPPGAGERRDGPSSKPNGVPETAQTAPAFATDSGNHLPAKPTTNGVASILTPSQPAAGALPPSQPIRGAPRGRGSGFYDGPRGSSRGRGGMHGGLDRGRGYPPRGYRGRGRGEAPHVTPVSS